MLAAIPWHASLRVGPTTRYEFHVQAVTNVAVDEQANESDDTPKNDDVAVGICSDNADGARERKIVVDHQRTDSMVVRGHDDGSLHGDRIGDVAATANDENLGAATDCENGEAPVAANENGAEKSIARDAASARYEIEPIELGCFD